MNDNTDTSASTSTPLTTTTATTGATTGTVGTTTGTAGEYKVSDYGIFTEGVATIQGLTTNLETDVTTLADCKTKISDQAIFMGPISESCVAGFGKVDVKIGLLKDNFATISKYLIDTSANYKAGDENASKEILRVGNDGRVTASSSKAINSGNANIDEIYNYLSSEGFSDAAIAGILANVRHESNFDPNALGDGGTSYGICQWHNSRWEDLKSFCNNNGLDSTTLDGQLQFLVWELQNKYTGVYDTMMSVPNTADGAYEAAYQWTVKFEKPDNMDARGQQRGDSAVNDYWPMVSA